MSASRSPAPRRDFPRRAPRAPARAGRGGGTLVGSVLGFLIAGAAAGGAALWAGGCSGDEPPGPSSEPTSRVTQRDAPSATPTASAAAVAEVRDAGAPPAPSAVPDDKPYTGPLLGAMALQTPVYPTPDFSKDRIGYIRLGGKVPVDPAPIKGSSCPKGWYRLLDGGYVCGKYSTLDVQAPQVRLGITAPNLDDVLPYKYAYNTAHGTPLYKSVPSKEDMMRYEPYLAEAKEKKRKRDEEGAGGGGAVPSSDSNAAPPAQAASVASPDTAVPAAGEDQSASAVAAAAALGLVDAGIEVPPEPPKPWWQQKQEKGKSLEVKLSDLESDADGTVAKRMVKGFFVAVDKTFGWNNRLWYKTTAGLVAPSDRMYIAKGPASQGIEVPDGVTQVGFITAAKAAKYEIDTEKKEVKTVGSVPRFSAFGLTGATTSVKTIIYRQTTEGWWMKAIDGTYTDPGARPADLAPGEKWVDVNLTRKTLLAFDGDKPYYAALVSPGKRSKKKEKDHSTPTGMYRIREKHITVTMDGDGAVAGDLPYSIEDVPYVAYYDRSYALHGAFWHSNFGREMSHGCVNLSPLDAKKIFFWTEPRLPRGWHAVWATEKNRGTLVVIHD
jgi:lipoprotein-anchoring transpeptidase ErfK/SrfK